MNRKIFLVIGFLSVSGASMAQAENSSPQAPTGSSVADLKDWSAEKKKTELLKVVENGDAARLEQMIQAHFDLMVKDQQGFTPLAIAVFRNHPEIVNLLLGAKVDLDTEDNYGRTPLFLAVIKDSIPSLEKLVHAGAWVDYKNKKLGKTALMLAAENRKFEAVKKLIEKHAQLDLQDKKGMTALMWAAKSTNADVINYLKKQHADTKLKSEEGKTYLDYWREGLRRKKLAGKKNVKKLETIPEEVKDEQNI